jgi:hypothetical protein
MREKWRERYWYLRTKHPRLKEPRWLHEDLDKHERVKTSDAEYERQKAYFRARREGADHGQ